MDTHTFNQKITNIISSEDFKSLVADTTNSLLNVVADLKLEDKDDIKVFSTLLENKFHTRFSYECSMIILKTLSYKKKKEEAEKE